MSAFNFDGSFYQVWIKGKDYIGRPITYTDELNLDDIPLTFDKLVAGLIDRIGPKFGPDNIAAVIESNPFEGWSRDITDDVVQAMDDVACNKDGYVKRTDPNAEHRLTSHDVLGGWM